MLSSQVPSTSGYGLRFYEIFFNVIVVFVIIIVIIVIIVDIIVIFMINIVIIQTRFRPNGT